MRARRWLLVVVIAGFAGSALAGEPGGSPLAGPKVEDRAETPAVERDFEGKMKPLGARPEVIALEGLTLSDEERARVDAVLAARAAVMERLIRENIDLLLRMRSAREGNDAEARRVVMREFGERFGALSEGGPLAEQLSGALSEENAAKFEEANRVLWRALAEQAPEGAGRAPRGSRVALRVLGDEVKRSYEAMIAEGKERLERVIGELQLTPQQEERVRAIVTEFGQKTKLNPSGGERARLFAEIASELTPEQRRRAFDLLRGS